MCVCGCMCGCVYEEGTLGERLYLAVSMQSGRGAQCIGVGQRSIVLHCSEPPEDPEVACVFLRDLRKRKFILPCIRDTMYPLRLVCDPGDLNEILEMICEMGMFFFWGALHGVWI